MAKIIPIPTGPLPVYSDTSECMEAYRGALNSTVICACSTTSAPAVNYRDYSYTIQVNYITSPDSSLTGIQIMGISRSNPAQTARLCELVSLTSMAETAQWSNDRYKDCLVIVPDDFEWPTP